MTTVLVRGSAQIYALLVTGLLFALTTLPGLIVLVLLSRTPGDLPLVALCALPAGPALSATLYALHHHAGDITDLHPARAFWRGYRANARGVLILWVPLLAWVAVLAFNLSLTGAAGLSRGWLAALAVILALALVWGANATVISSLFAFRARDAARLAAYYLTSRPSVPLGALALLAVAAGITVVWSEAVLVLAVPLLALGLLRTSSPMIADIRERFVEENAA